MNNIPSINVRFVAHGPPNIYVMSIKDYRLTSMEEPSDEILHELMVQVAAGSQEFRPSSPCLADKNT